MSEKLKPCPFCGCEGELFEAPGVYFVECSNPKCRYPTSWDTKEEAITAWNTRTIDNFEAYKLLHKTLLTVWTLIPNVEKGTALDELLVCANEIEKFLSQVDGYEGEL